MEKKLPMLIRNTSIAIADNKLFQSNQIGHSHTWILHPILPVFTPRALDPSWHEQRNVPFETSVSW